MLERARARVGRRPRSTPVSREWLNLFPRGCATSTPRPSGSSRARPPTPAEGPDPGELLELNGLPYLVLADGSVAELDPFSLAVATGRAELTGATSYDGDVDDLEFDDASFVDTRWPASTLQPVFGERCAQLVTEAGSRPAVRLVQDPQGEAAASGRQGESVAVDAGAGAYLCSGGWTDGHERQPVRRRLQGRAPTRSRAPARPRSSATAGTPRRSSPTPGSSCSPAASSSPGPAALCEPQVGAQPCA